MALRWSSRSSCRSAAGGSCSSSRAAESRSESEHCSATGSCGSSGAARLGCRTQRRRQDDPDRGAGGLSRAWCAGRGRHRADRGGQAPHRTQRQARLLLPARRGAETGTARTVLEATTHVTKLTPNKARALLGRFMFSGEESEKPLDGLSGGERRRLSLAILVHSGANVLILDKPTNHLDLESREALEQALSAFQGSLLLVSHDRALLDAVGTRTVAFEDATLHSYVGGWPEYVRAREERARTASAKPPAPAAKRKRPAHAKAAAPPKKSTRHRATSSSSSARSRRPKPPCVRSRRSSPIPAPGLIRRRPRARRPATSGRSRPRGAVRAVGGDRGLGPGIVADPMALGRF